MQQLPSATYLAKRSAFIAARFILQKLSPEVRAFFLAQACARHALGLAGLAFLSPSQAQRADCAGLNTLLASGLLSDGEVAGLQQQLVFAADDWKQLPGTARVINLGNCQRRGNVLKLPLPQTPSARQTAWDQCVHACGDKLWHCQNRCRAGACDACVADYSTCQAACGEAPALPPLTGG